MRNAILLLMILAQAGFSQTVIKKYPSGKIMSAIPYQDSLKQGTARYYHENGMVHAIIQFDHGKLTGVMREFYETGYHYREIDTKTLKAKIYSGDSSSYYVGTYDNSKFIRNGIWEEWDQKANFKRYVWTFTNDKKHGPYKAYRRDGSLEATGHYYYGTISDTLKLYDRNGRVKELQIWKADSDGKESIHLSTIYVDSTRFEEPDETINSKPGVGKGKKRLETQ
jgi:antitoxin component YwqK of YwqJK toxin-antitoxin module